jgi:integrase
MARRKFTDIGVRALRPKTKPYELVDTSGLRLCVFPSGAISCMSRYRRPDGRTAKVVHGKYGKGLTLAAARVAHTKALERLSEGVDPGAERLQAKAVAKQAEADRRADTLHKYVVAFLDHQGKRLRNSTLVQQRHVLHGIAMKAWGPNRAVTDIRRRDVIELAEEIAAERPIMANRVVSVLHRFFWWLTTRDVIPANPVSGVVRPTKESARERALSDAEIKALWLALDGMGGPLAAAIKTMLLTGQRRAECGGMRRSEISDGVWSLPGARTKNKKPHMVHLSRQALAVIAEQPVRGDFVFSRGGVRPVTDFSAFKKRLDAIAQLGATWRLHDLRRTAASGMQRLGVRPETIERCLNHRSGTYAGVVGVYQTDPLAEQTRDALARWGDHVERIVRGEEPGKIIQLRG